MRNQKAQDQGKKSTAEYAQDVLAKSDKPLHTKEIVPLMRAAGWKWPGEKPEHVVYTTLHGIVQRHGNLSEIRSLGKGMWATVDVAAHEKLEPVIIKPRECSGRQSATRTLPMVASNIPIENRRCGNCTYQGYRGIQELYLTRGECDNDNSNRIVVKNQMPACPHWSPRTVHRIREEIARQKILRLAVLTLNLQVARGRRP